jgi:hypothetical protein
MANDVKVIIFEEEHVPTDEDAWTEAPEGWSSPDPTDALYPQSDSVDKTVGWASVKFATTNPGTMYRMRLEISEIDIAGFDELRFDMKFGARHPS